MAGLTKYIAMQYNAPRNTSWHPSNWGEEEIPARLDPAWLLGRLNLFVEYCSHSLEQQIDKNFHLLLLFDRSTSKYVVDEVCGAICGVKVTPLFQVHGERAPFKDFVAGDCRTEFVSMTRFDSDDALAPTFMAEVERMAGFEMASGRLEHGPVFINFPIGMEYDTRTRTYTRLVRAFPGFATVVQKVGEKIVDPYAASHAKVGYKFDTMVAGSLPAQWCVVLHEHNIINNKKVRGEVLTGPPPFEVGRTKTLASAWPERVEKAGRKASLVAPRTVGNFLNFMMGKPLRL